MDVVERARRCPSCGKPFRPPPDGSVSAFCSDRCRLLDLGAWLTDRYAIPGESTPIDEEDSTP